MTEIIETKKRTPKGSRGAGHLSFDDFEPREQALLTLTAREKGLSIPDLMAEAHSRISRPECENSNQQDRCKNITDY